MIIGEKNTDLKDCQGDYNFAFWQKLGDFIETKTKKSPTSPGLVNPEVCERGITLLCDTDPLYIFCSV
jgi:hypothetical protein